jgi:histidinol-phosphatase (PHP family)
VGLEVDHYRGRMAALAGLFDQYPFDVLLGSVHWLGAWAFDDPDVGPFADDWVRRGAERAWDGYVAAIEELAASGAVDVLAHPDYMKTCGPMPLAPGDFYDRIVEPPPRAAWPRRCRPRPGSSEGSRIRRRPCSPASTTGVFP